ncbi:MAG: hypothetical protein HKO59_04700 [Phycisphaerales bacterium]|nr:hypothetical protein [Phycisphaerales bacterium]
MIELLAALPAVALIVGAIGGSVVFVTRSASPPASEGPRTYDATTATRRIATDLANTLGFYEITPTAIEFRVPDRTGNKRADVLRYAWSGVAGDPLTLTLNQQPPETILDNVHHLAFASETMSDVLEPLDEELAVIAYHDHAPDGHTHDHTIELTEWCAECFQADLPLGTTSWSLKRVRFVGKREGDDVSGVLDVRIESESLGKPSGIALEARSVKEASLDKNPGWVDVDFTSLNDLHPADVVCLVIGQSGGGNKAGKVSYEHGGSPMTADADWLTSDDGGSSWSSIVNDKDMRFYALGSYDTWVPTATTYIVGVRIEAQAGPSAATRAVRLASILNPVETGP